MSKIIPTEEQEHLAVMDWVNLNPEIRDNLIHVPNGGSRNKIEAVKLKKMGVSPGFPDFFLAIPKAHYHGLMIELKRLKGPGLSKHQEIWGLKLTSSGYFFKLCHGSLSAISTFMYYMNLDRNQFDPKYYKGIQPCGVYTKT